MIDWANVFLGRVE